MGMRHPQRVAGIVSLNTPHLPRAPVDPIQILRRRHGESMYIVQFQDPSRRADAILDGRVEQVFDCLMRRPPARAAGAPAGPASLDFVQKIADYDSTLDAREAILSSQERQVFVDSFRRSGFTGGINWYRNITRNWQRSADLDPTVRVPALMIMAELDAVLPPSAADGMERLVPDLEKLLVPDCGHWTQQERPEVVNAALIDWRRRRFG
jgi:microsomal epoxide hydrolase/non-specific protein-tyrosine kinase